MNVLTQILEKYWGFLALIIWMATYLLAKLVGLDPFGIDEQAARGLLLNWSISDNIINPIVIFGVPDFRALLFVPIGVYWPGSMLAAKILTLLIAFSAAALLYHWSKKTTNKETALIASALFLISPFLLNQIDAIGAAPFILLGMALGTWLDSAYRKKEQYFGGWYFMQMLWVTILLTLHPVALAYPLAIAWQWYKNPPPDKNSRHIYIGLVLATLFSMALRTGWENIAWLSNPIQALAIALDGAILWSIQDIQWLPAVIAAIFLVTIIIVDKKFLTTDLLGLMLLISILIGLFAADSVWASIACSLVLYRGIHHLIRLNSQMKKHTLIGQRGLVISVTFVVSLYFMAQDKTHALTNIRATLSPEDQLIQRLAEEAADQDEPFRAASQWPARSMLACKRDVLPLPPPIEDIVQFKHSIKGITHLIFDQNSIKNQHLVNNLTQLAGLTETLALLKGGVIIENREHNVELSAGHRTDPDKQNNQPIAESDAQQ